MSEKYLDIILAKCDETNQKKIGQIKNEKG